MRRTCMLLLLALVAGCGPSSPLDLDLRGVSITVPRLITPAVELVPSAPTPPVSLPPLPPDVVIPPPLAPPALTVPPPPACPKADSFAVPKSPVSPLVSSAPAAGSFQEAVLGSYIGGQLTGEITTTVTRLPASVSTTGQKVDSWTVSHTDLAHKSTDVEAYQLVHPGAVASGVYLVGLAWKDPVRGELSFVATGLGVEVLPNPVAVDSTGAGTQYAGAATDPNSLTTVAIVRNVTGKKRVDVCGQLVDTYTVAMTGTIVSPTTQLQLTWTQQLSTVFGVADIEDAMSLTSIAGGFAWNRTLRRTTVPKDLS